MNTFVIFLRAVNVSGKNLIKMAELKDVLANASFTNVQTYIQSGNIILNSSLSAAATEKEVASLIKKQFNLDVTTFVLTEEQLKNALKNSPFAMELPGNRVFITFLSDPIEKSLRDEINALKYLPEEFHCDDQVVYFYLPDGAANAKLSNNFFEKKLKINATGRNVNTVKKMLDLLAASKN
ncbi:DUF1697 domain-containing protein [Sphingobacterium hotanense]|uniref:DUF1697 domain-containing protein n=1 Tax=Sphingobacterium hotanense TaxID=649196 RepID=UPI0021A31D24|nr:DUF1697 domain-containing protein [Sphingobacterium hotanense]MCT1525139.1 DUF1697 domain-containing protein [Sphingobacterium hotanense]